MNYSEARNRMQPGDVLAFSGKGGFSNVIKWRTRSSVSHVGVVLQTSIHGDARIFNQIIESTSLDGFSGVITSRVSDRLRDYNGQVWWLPLSSEARDEFNEKRFFDWMFGQIGKAYDTKQAVGSAIDWIPFLKNKEDFNKLFCSELVAGGFEAAGMFDINSSEVTPIDVCKWKIYEGLYQLKGDLKEIPQFNTVNV